MDGIRSHCHSIFSRAFSCPSSCVRPILNSSRQQQQQLRMRQTTTNARVNHVRLFVCDILHAHRVVVCVWVHVACSCSKKRRKLKRNYKNIHSEKTISKIDLMSNGLYHITCLLLWLLSPAQACLPLLRHAPAQACLPLLYKVSMIMICRKSSRKNIETKTFLGHSTSGRIRWTSHQLHNILEWLQEWIWRSVRRVLVWQWLHPQDQ